MKGNTGEFHIGSEIELNCTTSRVGEFCPRVSMAT